MAETLVIVESPSKAKTIEKYLGSKYRVIASNGHVRDLPKSQLGVDVEHDFEPNILPFAEEAKLSKKYAKKQSTQSISCLQPTLIAREKRFRGILQKC